MGCTVLLISCTVVTATNYADKIIEFSVQPATKATGGDSLVGVVS